MRTKWLGRGWTYHGGNPLRDDLGRSLHNNSKSSTSTSPQGPEQVGILAGVGYPKHAVGRYDTELTDTINAEAVSIGQNGVTSTLVEYRDKHVDQIMP